MLELHSASSLHLTDSTLTLMTWKRLCMFKRGFIFQTQKYGHKFALKLFPKLPPKLPLIWDWKPLKKRASKVENKEWNLACFAKVFPHGSRIKQQICPPFNLYATAIVRDPIVLEAYWMSIRLTSRRRKTVAATMHIATRRLDDRW